MPTGDACGSLDRVRMPVERQITHLAQLRLIHLLLPSNAARSLFWIISRVVTSAS
eukprot:NODE_17116_length_301_cov_1.492063_g15949_i0.p2 GENE.NODE_17116_length_301_cov_1.492063_g15949_i0~~NODE_17116_length_301_cov_1.492063_g15949_i0.p2  ORF type:complete len:55 (-),score=0.94 NODE_17116_length_301_cov_1.492063_g15949_i0:52-216(-)